MQDGGIFLDEKPGLLRDKIDAILSESENHRKFGKAFTYERNNVEINLLIFQHDACVVGLAAFSVF